MCVNKVNCYYKGGDRMAMKLYRREIYLRKIRGFYHDTDVIKVITGVRRCGKSSLLEMVKDELETSGVNPKNIIFIDLDDKKYRKITTDDQLEKIIDQQSVANGMKYLFVDEIQNVKGFESVINGIRGKDYSIFVTGSNSYLLSGELTTKLTGRYVEFELFPLNFEEYLGMKKFYGKAIDPNLLIELNNYLNEGGFPKTIQYDSIVDKRTYVRSIVNEIFEKDIKKRVKIRKVEVFEKVRNFILNNFGTTFSILSLQEALVKDGLDIRRETIKRYVDVLVASKILCVCDRFDMKSKRALSGEKKYYLSDMAFYFSTNTDNRINYGPALENLIYIYLRSKDYTVSVGRIGKLECDFIVRSNDLNYAYIQVAYIIGISKKTEDREYAVLEKIRDNYPKYLVTTDYLLQKRNGIQHVNLMNFVGSGQLF